MERDKLFQDLDRFDDEIELALEGKDPDRTPEEAAYTVLGQRSLAERAADPNSQTNHFYHKQVFDDVMFGGSFRSEI